MAIRSPPYSMVMGYAQRVADIWAAGALAELFGMEVSRIAHRAYKLLREDFPFGGFVFVRRLADHWQSFESTVIYRRRVLASSRRFPGTKQMSVTIMANAPYHYILWRARAPGFDHVEIQNQVQSSNITTTTLMPTPSGVLLQERH